MEQVDCVVIGAGVVGLACARAFALAGREVIVLEAAGAIGTETSSRNSEVIHAGIYYPPGSAKALLCVQGKALLYRYCEAHGVGHRRCGKLIVATEPGQIATLDKIQAHAAANDVRDLLLLAADEAHAMEPALRRCPLLALDRHHRQPRPDARLPGRSRGPWRHARPPQPGERR